MESCTRRDDPTGSTACQVTRHRAGDTRDTVDRVVDETPVALVFNGISHTVTCDEAFS